LSEEIAASAKMQYNNTSMKNGYPSKNKRSRPVRRYTKRSVTAIIAMIMLFAGCLLVIKERTGSDTTGGSDIQSTAVTVSGVQPDTIPKPEDPLLGKQFYVDKERTVNALAMEYTKTGKTAEAQLLNRIASQPGTTWLTGPSADDQTAARDVKTIERTSKEAAKEGTVPVYMLYALPGRDACADYSKGGFQSEADYLAWVDRTVQALQTDAVIVVEPDAIAHTLKNTCLSSKQIADRYALLNKAVAKLSESDRVLGVYLDAGHSEWLPDPTLLVEPLQKSGIVHARGISVNVSFFAETTAATKWSQQLAGLLGDKGVLIDTSRNGKGIAPVTGVARWCNPPGRGLGPRPSTDIVDQHIDAYFWGKNPGESDGDCFGNPDAGTFVPGIALDLARNAIQ
jgi:endoglucanase